MNRRDFFQQAGASALWGGWAASRPAAQPAAATQDRRSEARSLSADTPQIFVDLSGLEKLDNVRQFFHTADKHPANPVIRAEHPWELYWSGPTASVIFDREERVFKCWYQGSTSEPGKSRNLLCYARSQDGVAWEKPPLGLHEVNGTRRNNVVVPPDHHEGMDHWESVLKDPLETDPRRLYKGLGWSSFDWDGPLSGIYSMTSPDGLNWTHTAEPVFHYHPRPGTADLGPVGDAQALMIDTARRRYVALMRRIPQRVFSVSQDFVHWTPPQASLEPLPGQPGENTLYNHSAFLYGDQYLGLVTYFHRDDRDPRHAQLDLRLLSSSDGLRFSMPGPDPHLRDPLVANGGIADWDRWNVRLTGAPPVRVGDKLHIYYRGSSLGHKPYRGDDSREFGGIGLALLRVDGFASLGAGFEGGWVTTRPLQFASGTLHLNAKADFGRLSVEVLDETGRALPGFAAAENVPLSEDGVQQPVKWREKDIRELAGRPLRLRFHLVNARLFSYTFRSA